MMNFKEIYEKSLIDAEKRDISANTFYDNSKPVVTAGIISPESSIIVQPLFNVKFKLDKAGMYTLIEKLEEMWEKRPGEEWKHIYVVLTELFNLINNYLGGFGNPNLRQKTYMDADNACLNLSEIRGKKIGLCAERASIGHQLLSILEKAGLIDFEPFFVNTLATIKNEKFPHSLIMLKRKSDSKYFLYDIENPLQYKLEDGKYYSGIGLYCLSEDEHEDFISGRKCISPKTIYDLHNYQVLGEKLSFGNGPYKKRSEHDDEGEIDS